MNRDEQAGAKKDKPAKIDIQDDVKLASRTVDKRAERFHAEDLDELVAPQPGTLYYRARQFNAPAYNNQIEVETRSDFRNTIYWNPSVEVGYSGRKTIEFYASDDITSFRTTIEGISADGSIGRCEANFLPNCLLQ